MSLIMQQMNNSTEDSRSDEFDYKAVHWHLPSPSVVDVKFKNITLTVSEGWRNKRRKTILKGVSGKFKSGELTAIMGPSGAGKSSLMNALTGFATHGVTGTISAGSSVCDLGKRSLKSLKQYKKKSSYIMQDDRLNPLFTVRELMTFATDVKLGKHFDDEYKICMIQETLQCLGLAGTEETRCSNLSGGQRKRLSIAVELIDNPSVLFLDEPTTGLDSRSSSQCVTMLKKLATNGRTVVCTIHQPSATIYSMFDQVYVLAGGQCIYNGPSADTVPYFAAVGLQCPKYHNPADYVLEVANGEYGNFTDFLANHRAQSEKVKPRAITALLASSRSDSTISQTSAALHIPRPNEFYRFGKLFRRCLIEQYRDWTVTHLKLLLHFIIGALLGQLYQGAGKDGSKTFSNISYLMVSSLYLWYTSIMPAVLKFPSELLVLKKENFNNWYHLRTYYLAAFVTSIPLQISFSLAYAIPSYLLSGQPMEWSRFLMFVLVLSNVTILADVSGNVIGCLLNPINGTFVGAILSCWMLAFAGFLALLSHMNSVLKIISNASFLKFSFEALAITLYSYGREPLLCPATKEYCHMRHPKEIMKIFSIQSENYWCDIGVLLIDIIVFRFIGYYTLNKIIKRSR